ncbi:MAG: Asp-tRNA(Asn)/Glu-tRNA(Gln) amidotransferase subunit GatC [Acidiferrobacter sp.]
MNQHDIEKIAHLARLEVSEQECLSYAQALSRILGLIEQMDAIDTRDVLPMTHPETAALRCREDAVTMSGDRDRLLALAPAASEGLYLVPRVIE